PLLASGVADMVVLGLVTNQSELPSITIAQSVDQIDGIERAVGLLEEYPDRAWRMSELSREVHMPPRKLSAAFKERTGSSPLEYWNVASDGTPCPRSWYRVPHTWYW